ncbi:tetratricopeptide repeat protein [Streptomyces sp. MB09-02B]|uniref:tetratricopeptide repeat protein n=1 Tax=Streptomyces sp. MB09-02B TaxID=3028667 RepID=UPI0029BB6BF6|nr:tetratricopeptide repeat protein [Streptomyces sp. MB09-02B]MDX3638308.1 tetratricopeptide repeat protein [Streptomyces sp. MB09-02B]
MRSANGSDTTERPVSVLVTVTRKETTVSVDGTAVVTHEHRGLTRAVLERLWRLTLARAGRPSLTRFDPATSRTTPASTASRYAVHALGLAIGEAFLGGPAGDAVARALDTSGPEQPVWIGIAVSVPEFAGLPWETVLLPGAPAPLALSPRVRFHRAPTARQGPVHAPAPVRGPRILAAFADPLDDLEGPALDLEADARRIVGAVEAGLRQRHIDVETIDGPDTLTEIRRAMTRRPCDILHLSCHARADALLLEDGRGRTHPTTARDLADAIPAGGAPRLVVLAGCSTGAGRSPDGPAPAAHDEEQLTGLASELVASGVPSVLAMTAAVSDSYAAAFCAELYSLLRAPDPEDGVADLPAVLDAVAEARQRLEKRRRQEHAGPIDLCEWPTPALFLGASPLPARPRPMPRSAGPRTTPAAPPAPGPHGDVRPVARRAVLRHLMRLWDEGCAALLLYGPAGVGKSTLVGQFLQRLATPAEDVVRIGGAAAPSVLTAACRKVADHPPGRPPLIVVVDDVETEPVPGHPHARCADPLLARQLAAWADRPDRYRLIITSRHRLRLPTLADSATAAFHLGPLSSGESRLLIGRLPGLSRFPDKAVRRVLAEIGGHPAGLGLVDALVRGAAPVLPGLEARLTDWLAAEGLSRTAVRSAGLGAAIRSTYRLLARDTGVDRLLRDLTPAEHTVLVSLSVHRHPVRPDDLADRPETGSVPARETIALLESRGLLTAVDAAGTATRPTYFVCRWLASLLAGSEPPERMAAAHERAARHWLDIQRSKGDTARIVLDLTESRHHFRQAGLIDEAFTMTVALVDRLRPTGAFAEVERLARESLAWTPLEDHAAAVLHDALGSAAQDTGRFTEARTHRERALELFTRIGFEQAAAIADLELGTLEEAMGEYPAAKKRYQRALVTFTGPEDLAEAKRARHFLGSVAIATGDTAAARDHYEALVDLEAAQPDEESPAGTAAALHQLGVVEHNCGRLNVAEDHYRRALAAHEQLGDRTATTSGYLQLALLAQEQGDRARATVLCRRAMRIGDEVGDVAATAAGEHLLGMIADDAGEPGQARAHYERALAFLTLAGDRAAVGTVQHQLGVLAQGTGETERARDLYLRALTVAEDCGDRYGAGRSRHQLGLLTTAEGDPAGALVWHRQALEIFEAIEDHDGRARALSALSERERLAGSPETAFGLALRGFVAGLECGPQTPVAATALYELADVAGDLGDRRFRELLSASMESSAADALVEAVRAAQEFEGQGFEDQD